MEILALTRACWRWLLDALAPRLGCLCCGKPSPKSGLCAACLAELSAFLPEDTLCPVCGEPGDGAPCPHCAARRPAFTAARGLFAYEGAARRLILAMKYEGEYDIPAEFFAWRFKSFLAQANWEVDAVVPVPSRLAHLLKTGYNQAAIPAKRLASALSLPFWPHALRRPGLGKSQVPLTRAQRLENARGAFLPGTQAKKLKGRRVLLIDDVLTTGATANACAEVLLALGASSVHVLCAARSLLQGDRPSDHEQTLV
ncbi:MAG: ComF family protein [Christensenellaceae bacterium]|jgi:ComF family protein|nr:ComF family protein [Christensenellaceae bacterium]